MTIPIPKHACVPLLRMIRDLATYATKPLEGQVVERTAQLTSVNQQLTRELAERKQAEAELRQTEERFRLLVEGVRDYAILMLDKTGHVISWNLGAERIKGYQAQEIIGQHFSRFYPDAEVQRRKTKQELAIAVQVGQFHEEGELVRKDGSLFIADVTITALFDEAGELRGFAKVTRDITERRRGEVALHESEAKLRALFEVLPVGIFIQDRQRRVIESNPALQRILKVSKEGLANGAYLGRKIIHPDGAPLLLEELPSQRAFEQQQAVFDVEMGVILETGQTVWISVSAVLVSMSTLEVVVVINDITERKRIEAALAQERDSMQALMDNIPDTIYFKDTASRFTRINSAQARVLGLGAAQEAIGKTDADFQAPHLADEFYGEEQQLLQTGQSLIDRQEFNPTPDGQPRWFSATKVPIFDRQGRVTGLIGISRDITGRIKAELALQRVNDQLTDRVGQMSLLQELEEQLQACVAVEEIYEITAKLASQLFRAEVGALYVINNSRNWVETAVAWGASPAESQAFGLADCWALRRGRTHLSGVGYANIACQHLKDSRPAFSSCMPLLAQGETLGVLHLRATLDSDAHYWDEAKQQLARVVADSVALALANLKLRETLRQQAIRDPLTGLFNRRYMEESLERELQRAARKQQPVGIIMLDVDHFKRINDTYGHNTGDAVLRQLGHFLNQFTRGGDIVCRYGGEEFIIILPEVTLDQVALRAEQLRKGFKAMTLEYNSVPIGPVTLSLGVAIYSDHGKTGDDTMRAADAALYRAKRAGRDQVVVAR